MKNIIRKTLLFILCISLSFALLGCSSINNEVEAQEDSISVLEIVDDKSFVEKANDEDIATIDLLVSNIDGMYIGLLDNASITNSSSVFVSSNVITITAGGTYTIVGSLSDGQLIVDSDATTTLVLSGVEIYNSNNAAIYIYDADLTTITLADNTINKLSDGAIYSETSENINGTLYSKDDLIINGTGILEISANYNDGIVSKDSLTIDSGTINIVSVGDAIYGKDSITINDGTFSITTGNGAEENLTNTISQSTISNNRPSRTVTLVEEDDDSISSKGIKSTGLIVINNGIFNLDTYDDGIHSDYQIEIKDGTFNLQSGDDGIHADEVLTIDNGEFIFTYVYEGFEAKNIIVNDGYFNVIASDDGFNAPNDEEAGMSHPAYTDFDKSVDSYIEINGGTFDLWTYGDGIDANGGVEINGGTIYAETTYRQMQPDSGIDFDNTSYVNGGEIFLISPEMEAHEFDSDSEQNSFKYTFNSVISGETEVEILDSDGNILASHDVTTSFKTLIFSSDSLVIGESYTIVANNIEYEITLTGNVTIVN